MKQIYSNLASLSIDLDGLNCYHAIHGLPLLKNNQQDPIFNKALPRFKQLLDDFSIPATLFTVAQDLYNPSSREALSPFLSNESTLKHEFASHSLRHDYHLSRLSLAQIEADLNKSKQLIENFSGEQVLGFRAPGYNLSETLLDALESLGFQYDSSLFPSPAYYSLRALAIAKYRLQGKKSHSLRGDIKEFTGPRSPFIPHKKHRFKIAPNKEQARKIYEIPMSVASPLRFPWLGTTINMMPQRLGENISKLAIKENLPIVLELHAIDFSDPSDGFCEELKKYQKDINIPWERKKKRLYKSIEQICKKRDFQTLCDFPAPQILSK